MKKRKHFESPGLLSNCITMDFLGLKLIEFSQIYIFKTQETFLLVKIIKCNEEFVN